MKALNSQPSTLNYTGLPFKSGGRDRTGLDCAGLAWLWLSENFPSAICHLPLPPSASEHGPSKSEDFLDVSSIRRLYHLERGDTIFFRHRGKIRHVGIWLGENKWLHILAGSTSRIETGFTLIKRLGFEPVAAIPPSDAERLCKALADPALGWVTAILLLISVALSVVSSFLLRPTLSSFKQASPGRYSQSNPALQTQKSPEIPLPDLLGNLVVSGNSIYQQLPLKSAATSDSPPQAWNQIIILNSGPSQLFSDPNSIQINGLAYNDGSFHSGTNVQGIYLNPVQDKAHAVTGSIAGDTYVPNVTLYNGDYQLRPTLDIRGYYDRFFPVYGLQGCTFIVGRWFDSTKFQQVNLTSRLNGRLCRSFDNTGFIVHTSTGTTTADGATFRFPINPDVALVHYVKVDGTPYTEISPVAQAGQIYYINRTKGYVEFLSAPANGAVVSVSYDYYPRHFSQNPAEHIIYLLTEPMRGKGFPADRIDWTAADSARQYYDASVTWFDSNGQFTTPRYQTNYAIDTRKPIQDHLQALLDACHSVLFLSSGRFVLSPIKDGSSVFSFDTTSIMLDDSGNSTFEADLVDRAPKANRVRLAFHSQQTLNAETEVVADDEDNQLARSGRAGDNGIVDEQLKFPAVTSVPQAERLAETLLREHVGSNWLYTWLTSIQGLALQPGDIVDVTHPSLPVPAKLLRIETLEHDENDRLKITASEYVPSAYL